MTKNKFYSFNFKNSLFKIHYGNGELLMHGRLSKFKKWELQLNNYFGHWNKIYIASTNFRKLWNDLVYTFEYSIGPFWGCFNITDVRIWDDHTDKPVLWDEMIKLQNVKREGKPKYKPRRQNKEKWYFTSQFLKLYNFDFLNDPYGITVDFAWFPFLIYSLIQIGIHPRHRFTLAIDADFSEIGPVFTFELCLFTLFVRFEIGKNTVVRRANFKYSKDFNTLVDRFANPYLSDNGNILIHQIQRKNLSFIENILNKIDITKFDTDEIIIESMYEDWYNSEIFELLLKNIQTFNKWDDVEESCDCYHPDAITKLKERFSQNIESI